VVGVAFERHASYRLIISNALLRADSPIAIPAVPPSLGNLILPEIIKRDEMFWQ